MADRHTVFALRRPAVLRLTALLLVSSFGLVPACSKTEVASKPKPSRESNVRSGESNAGPQASAPRRIEQAPRIIPVTKVEPNARSKALAAAEAIAAGLPPEAAADLPSKVDHSTSVYFAPIKPQTAGDCTCYSSTYYYNTFMQAQDEGLDASRLDPTRQGLPRNSFAVWAPAAMT